jgi:hypothetical protein
LEELLNFDIFGMSTHDSDGVSKIKYSHTAEGLSFCGRVFYYEAGQLRSGCDLLRTLPKFHLTPVEQWMHRGVVLPHDVMLRSLLKAKAMAYYATDSHTPIIGPLCSWLIDELHEQPLFEQDLLRRWERAGISYGSSVSTESRLCAYQQTGVTPTAQEYTEKTFTGPVRDVGFVLPALFDNDKFLSIVDGFIVYDENTIDL